MKRRFRLLIPGLFGPIEDPDGIRTMLPELPALSRLLSRARATGEKESVAEAAIMDAFGLSAIGGRSLAALAVQGEDTITDATRGSEWMRLDPVHLRADMAQLRVFGGASLNLTMTDAEPLAALVAPMLAESGLELHLAAPERWYVAGDHPIDLDTYPVARVLGRNVEPFQPTGADAPAWARRLTEIQMVLHSAKVNQARERAGELPVNSLWPWGAGPIVAPLTAPVQVVSREPLVLGAGRIGGSWIEQPSHALPDTYEPGLTLGTDFGLRDVFVQGDASGWLCALERLETEWFAPLLDHLLHGALDSLEICGGSGTAWQIDRQALRWHFWRRPRDWRAWLATPST